MSTESKRNLEHHAFSFTSFDRRVWLPISILFCIIAAVLVVLTVIEVCRHSLKIGID